MIYLVAGDEGSQVEVALYNADGTPRDLTDWITRLRVRQSGAASANYTLTGASTPQQVQAGLTTFTFSADNLANAGLFDAEVFTTQGALISTDYPLMTLLIREDF